MLRVFGDVRNSSDNVYSGTLTGKTEDGEGNTDRFTLPQLSWSYSLPMDQLLHVKAVLWLIQWKRAPQSHSVVSERMLAKNHMQRVHTQS